MNHPSKLGLSAVTLTLLSASLACADSYIFQQGAGGYTGAVDTGIQQGNPNTLFGTATSLTIDLGSASSSTVSLSAILLRFDSIFGSGAGQVPLNSPVTQATLTLNIVDAGSGIRVFDMLTPWNEAITWNSSFGTPGFPAPGAGAAATPVATVGSDSNLQNVPLGTLTLDLTASLQAQQTGSLPGQGWVLLPWPTAGWNGVDVNTSDVESLSLRPLLTIVTIPEPTATGLLLLGMFGLTGQQWLARRRAGECEQGRPLAKVTR